MKLFAATLPILPMILLPSCTILLEDPTLTKPSRKDLSGQYVVSKKSPLTPHKKEISAISLELKNDGSFRMSDPRNALLREGTWTGSWNIIATYGLDLGSRQCWGVQLVRKDRQRVMTFDCLGNEQPDRLLISGAYIPDAGINCYFVMKKSERSAPAVSDKPSN
jgi:hypothetical protein